MSANTIDPEYFVFDTNRLPSWTVPFLSMLSLATSCVDAMFFQKGQAQHLDDAPRGFHEHHHESSSGGWSLCDDPVKALSDSGHPMAPFYRDQFNM